MTNSYRLKNLTDPREVQDCHEHNFVAWGKGLSLKDYLKREQVFASSPTAANGGLTYWVLQEEQPDGSWKSVCSMETLARPALCKQKGKPILSTLSHSVGSVFTPAANRRKGYAAEMFERGVKAFDDWQMDNWSEEKRNASFSVLWSDIGDYYSRFEYEKTDSKELKFTLSYADGDSVQQWPEGVTPIGLADLEELVQQDITQLKKQMEEETEKDGVTRVAVEPTLKIYQTAFIRATYLAPFLSKTDIKTPSVFGARHGKCWTIWTQDFSADKMTALRIFAEEGASKEEVRESTAKLVYALLAEASRWQFPVATIWDQDIPSQITIDELSESLASTTIVKSKMINDREDSWPMIRFHGGDNENKKWVLDGKYAWF
ncbi:lysine acetyltransferase [Trichomonascus vanleenenianus]|uniref:uncharacterized protein n=1 Tax=Trichomonascus vanleenenianus TaxID=2268995 RepID=UPI003ECA2364